MVSAKYTARGEFPLTKDRLSDEWIYKPEFYRLSDSMDKIKFHQLLNDSPDVVVYDKIQSQLEDLVRSLNPKINFTKEELTAAAKDHICGVNSDQYGVWVYYPWLKKIVHLLDKKEFIDVRTTRNLYKITLEERDKLSEQKIGVIGLSVGQAVSITMAMERSFGEIRLADFDDLELTNLNRIRTGVHNIGISKVIIAAREIAEIDPFLKVTCFTQGLTEDNIDNFFMEGGKLDMVIDECDSVDIKILCRQKAKELKIPVIMDTCDRGMLDVERFDREPDRSILHGLIDHLDLTRAKELKTNEEKIPYLLPMAGIETVSSRLKASLMEVGHTISTWPQLATTVALGGALAGDICRRIALDQFHESGRYFVDFEQLIADKKIANNEAEKRKEKIIINNVQEILTKEEILRIILKCDLRKEIGQVEPDTETIKKIAEAATLAPSGGNCQPWKWAYYSGRLFLFYDQSRSGALLDFQDIASYIALGAATENAVLKAHACNMAVKISKFPLKNDPRLIAVFDFYKKNEVDPTQVESTIVDSLADAIPIRLTNRKISKRQPIEAGILHELQKIAMTIQGAKLYFLEKDEDLSAIGNIVGKAEKLRLMHQKGHRDFVNEIRWSKEENEKKKDGIDLATLDLTTSEITGLKIARDWKAIECLKQWKAGSAFERLSQKTIGGASAIGFITMPEYNPLSFFEGGRAVQRVWLKANQNNISFQPQSPITFLFARLLHGEGADMSTEMIRELTDLRKQFKKLFPLDDRQGEIFLFRLCIADALPAKSLRRSIEDVLVFINKTSVL